MPTRTFAVTVIRPDDLLLVRLEFRDVDFTAGTPPTIAGQPGALVVAHFQPQHVAEEAFWEITEGTNDTGEGDEPGQPPPPSDPVGSDTPKAPGNVASILAGPTRLAFTIPSGRSFPLTVEGVLHAIATLPLSVTAVARYEPPSGCGPQSLLKLIALQRRPKIVPPLPSQTAIELPYRLLLSPDDQARWEHASMPVEHDGRVELWHTRLGSRRANGDPRVRAVWSPDFNRNPQAHANTPFRSSLDARDRNEIVQLTSNWELQPFLPTPVATERMMLTTLGGWLDVEGRWSPPLIAKDLPDVPSQRSLTVENWRHLATMGRDHYVRVVYAGFLFPFGHRASLVKITERKFIWRKNDPTPGFIAYDLQRMFIIVREPRRTYGPRDLPFRTIDIVTKNTPDLAKPEESDLFNLQQSAFWPRISTGGAIVDFPFKITAYDWEGRAIDFATPLLFVDKDVDVNRINDVIADYEAMDVMNPRRRSELHGQPVAFAPPSTPGDTTLETDAITFDAAFVNGTPHFRPTMKQSETDVPAVQQLLGKNVPSTIEWEPTYASQGGQTIGNAAQLFARVKNAPKLVFDTDKSGGLSAPNIDISGLSRSLGPIGGVADDMVNGTFDPAKFLPDVTLMGGIKLSDIIRVATFVNAASTGGKLPTFLSTREGEILRTTYTFKLAKEDLIITDLFEPQDGAELVLQAIVEKRPDATPPAMSTNGHITNFSVVLLPAPDALRLARLDFKEIAFKAEPGKKLDTSVDFGGVTFLGILEFVNELRKFIPGDGFKDPPSLELVGLPDPGVIVGFSIGLPTIGVGVMTMQNVSLAASFYLPFGSKPMNFHFAFCERHQPFILTVSLFGGGGFFAIDIGLKGVVSLEAALEFGASISLNLGVASGSATIMAGFYYHMTETGFEFTGYFRACGSMSVLGIITVTIEFYLGLTYASKGITPHGGHLWGQASVTVKIEILFFSISVGVTLEREFAGSDPTFRQLVAPDDWAAYCGAFDDYPAVGE